MVVQMINKGGDSLMAEQLSFQIEESGSIPTSPLQLEIVEISLSAAKVLNRKWHSSLPEYETGFMPIAVVCYGAKYDNKFYAGAIWNNPSSPSLPQEWLELRRMAISPDAPRNTATRMLKIMAMLIKHNCPQYIRLISYQDTSIHYGTIYKASGWKATNKSCGNKKQRAGKYRELVLDKADNPKIRWEYTI